MVPLMENPFEHYDWTDSELLFVMSLSKETEQILVGTKAGILKYLQDTQEVTDVGSQIEQYIEQENFTRRKEVSKTPRDIAKSILLFAVAAITTSGEKAVKLFRANRRYEREVQIPFVCEASYPIGRFLLDFEKDREWGKAVHKLVKGKVLKKKQGGEVDEAKEFLLRKWRDENPVCKYAALSIWKAFCSMRNADDFKQFAEKLIDAFSQDMEARPNTKERSIKADDPILRIPKERCFDEDEVRVWVIPGLEREFIIARKSFYSLKVFYRVRANEFGVKYRLCRICGDVFPTTHQTKSICDRVECDRQRRAKNKADYENKNKDNVLESQSKRIDQKVAGAIKKAKEDPDISKDKLGMLEKELEKFRSDRKERKEVANKARDRRLKKNIETQSEEEKAFVEWLFEKEKWFDRVMGNM